MTKDKFLENQAGQDNIKDNIWGRWFAAAICDVKETAIQNLVVQQWQNIWIQF